MIPFGVTIPATVPQRSEIPEGLTNYPVQCEEAFRVCVCFLLPRLNCACPNDIMILLILSAVYFVSYFHLLCNLLLQLTQMIADIGGRHITPFMNPKDYTLNV
jgi:hypothetical protein